MDKHNIWRYFCLTEGGNIFEPREINQGPPSVCINDSYHDIDTESLTLIKSGDKHEYRKDNPHMVTAEQVGLGLLPNLKFNLVALTPPTESDDLSQHYDVGSRWIDIIGGKEYVCVNPTEGSAIWKDTTSEGGSIDNAINVGSSGIGIFKQKTDTTFEFKKISLASNKLILSDDLVNDVVKIDLDESKININNLLGAPSSAVVGENDEQYLTNKTLIDPRVSPGIKDLNGNDLLIFQSEPNAVNSVKIKNASSTLSPSIRAHGGDTNIDLEIKSKGTGRIRLGQLYWPNSDGLSQQVIQTDGFGNLSFANVDTRKEEFVTTSNSTPIAISIINTAVNMAYYIDMIVTAKRTVGALEVATFERKALFVNENGVLSLEAEDNLDIARNRMWHVEFVIQSSQIRIEVTGEIGKTINWCTSYKMTPF